MCNDNLKPILFYTDKKGIVGLCSVNKKNYQVTNDNSFWVDFCEEFLHLSVNMHINFIKEGSARNFVCHRTVGSEDEIIQVIMDSVLRNPTHQKLIQIFDRYFFKNKNISEIVVSCVIKNKERDHSPMHEESYFMRKEFFPSYTGRLNHSYSMLTNSYNLSYFENIPFFIKTRKQQKTLNEIVIREVGLFRSSAQDKTLELDVRFRDENEAYEFLKSFTKKYFIQRFENNLTSREFSQFLEKINAYEKEGFKTSIAEFVLTILEFIVCLPEIPEDIRAACKKSILWKEQTDRKGLEDKIGNLYNSITSICEEALLLDKPSVLRKDLQGSENDDCRCIIS